jgi:CMP-N-acetylneuraminic acid synthetase
VDLHTRSPEAASDTATMADVIWDVYRLVRDTTYLLLLQPTSPLRHPAILGDVLMVLDRDYSAVVSAQPGRPDHVPPQKLLEGHDGACMRPILADWDRRTQDCGPTFWRDGQVYGYRTSALDLPDPYGDRVFCLIGPAEDALSIDTPEDWAEAERRIRARERLELSARTRELTDQFRDLCGSSWTEDAHGSLRWPEVDGIGWQGLP